jgi:hypothetical protein
MKGVGWGIGILQVPLLAANIVVVLEGAKGDMVICC